MMKTNSPSPVRARSNVKRRTPSQQTAAPPVVNVEYLPEIGYLANADDIDHLLQGFFDCQVDGNAVRLVPQLDCLPTAMGSRPLVEQLAYDCERVARLYQHTAAFLRQLEETERGVENSTLSSLTASSNSSGAPTPA